MRLPRQVLRTGLIVLMLFGLVIAIITGGVLVTGSALTPEQVFDAWLGLTLGTVAAITGLWSLIRSA